MKFIDYSKFRGHFNSLGFAKIETIHNGEILIHRKNVTGTLELGLNSIGKNYFLIGGIIENIKQKCYEGIEVTVWNKDIDSFCDEIFNFWLLKQPLMFNEDIKWLLQNCNKLQLKKIIDSNKKQWQNDIEFKSCLKKFNYRENSIILNRGYLEIRNNFFYEIWENSDKWAYDENLQAAIFEPYDENILIKALHIDTNWINNIDFIQRSKRDSALKNAVSSFLLNKVAHRLTETYDDDIKWIITNGNDSDISIILEFKFLYANEEFISDFLKSEKKYNINKYNLSLYYFNSWKYSGELKLNNDIIWIFKNGPASIVENIFKINYSNWINDSNFIFNIRNINRNEYSFSDPYSAETEMKMDIFLNFVFNIWNTGELKELDDNLKWLIQNGNFESLNRFVNHDKQRWLSDEDFIDYIRETKIYNKNEFKLNFLIEACMNKTKFKNNETVSWVLGCADIEVGKSLLISKLGYNEYNIEKIYAAFFPSNNIDYYRQKAYISDWSEDFSIYYVSNHVSKIHAEFKNIFLNELNISERKISKRNNEIKKTHSASDLANFVFCPVSYALNQTFYIDINEQENVFIGNNEHEKLRLLNLSDSEMRGDKEFKSMFPNFNNDFKRIINSRCISQGHKDKNPVIYFSKKKKLSGIPDYIFQDINGYFAVEEKYTFKKYDDITDLYLNHKAQALVYLYGLDQFQFNEVYVLYWFLSENKYGEYYVYKYKLFRVIKTEENKKMIINVFNDLESIQQRIPYIFTPDKINYKKCIKCNYFPYCEYKKGNNSNIILPELNIKPS